MMATRRPRDWDYLTDQPLATAAAQLRSESDPPVYSWAATYNAGSDVMIYRRFKGPLPAHVPVNFSRDTVPPRIAAFCEENGCDVALYDELRGIVRKPRIGSDEAP